VAAANNGDFSLEGRLPIATMGGLKARGHPVGATGVYQIVETALLGGSGATIVTTILSTEK